MPKSHAFSQAEILCIARCKRDEDSVWSRFSNIVNELGFHLTTTGGNFLTHKINCNEDEFNVILELVCDN